MAASPDYIEQHHLGPTATATATPGVRMSIHPLPLLVGLPPQPPRATHPERTIEQEPVGEPVVEPIVAAAAIPDASTIVTEQPPEPESATTPEPVTPEPESSPPPLPPAPASGVLSDGQLAELLSEAGWPSELHATAIRIIRCESGGDPTAVNWAGPYRGLLQILDSNFAIASIPESLWLDPLTNLRMGYILYQRAGGFGPWGCA